MLVAVSHSKIRRIVARSFEAASTTLLAQLLFLVLFVHVDKFVLWILVPFGTIVKVYTSSLLLSRQSSFLAPDVDSASSDT